MNDQPRPDTTGPDYEHTLSIEAVADRYAGAGYPRTIRTLQRYCASGHLDAQKVATALGDKYFVAPYSVTRHLAQIAEMAQLATRHDTPRQSEGGRGRMSPGYGAPFHHATGHDNPMTGHVATDHDIERQQPYQPSIEPQHAPRQTATSADPSGQSHDQPRPVDPGLSPRYVERLEAENAFLRNQVDKKDHQIEALLERDRETNVLVQGLQRMLGPLLGMPSRDSRNDDQTGRDSPR